MARPLIWRQLQKGGSFKLTKRLRSALNWYIAVMQRCVQRAIPFARALPDNRLILYSDAEGNGQVASVAIRGATRIYMRGRIPNRVRHMLKSRKTNIVAYELFIAVAAVVTFCPELLINASILHFVDSTPAISCILKGYSKQGDLSDIAGRLWFECAAVMCSYIVEYVKSSCNLADGPSRGDISLMDKLGFVEVPFRLPAFRGSLSAWMHTPCEPNRMVV